MFIAQDYFEPFVLGLSFVMGEFISSGEIDDNICMNIEEYGGIVRKVVGRCDGKADYYVAESMKGEIWKNYATEVVSSAWLVSLYMSYDADSCIGFT